MFRSGPDRVEYNWVGPSRGHKIDFFGFGPGQGKIYIGAKNLTPQDSNCNFKSSSKSQGDGGYPHVKTYGDVLQFSVGSLQLFKHWSHFS